MTIDENTSIFSFDVGHYEIESTRALTKEELDSVLSAFLNEHIVWRRILIPEDHTVRVRLKGTEWLYTIDGAYIGKKA